jgi:hypothetical protein
MKLLICLLAAIIASRSCAQLRGVVNASGLLQSDQGTEILLTANCINLPDHNFKARLDLFYLYLVEWYPSTKFLDLEGIDEAIAHALVNVLHDCDASGRPRYGVELYPTSRPVSQTGKPIRFLSNDALSRKLIPRSDLTRVPYCSYVTDGVCSPVSNGTECRVVQGKTSILLDSTTPTIEDVAYNVIQQVLQNNVTLTQYTAINFYRAELVQRIGQNLVLLPAVTLDSTNTSSGLSIATQVGIGIGVITFGVGTLFIYGLYRRRYVNDAMIGSSFYKAKRRKFFNELGEEGLEPGWMTTEPDDLPTPSITWSVSDLTSDSLSLRSSLPMNRIDEAPDEDISHEGIIPMKKRRSSLGNACDTPQLGFIEHWKPPEPFHQLVAHQQEGEVSSDHILDASRNDTIPGGLVVQGQTGPRMPYEPRLDESIGTACDLNQSDDDETPVRRNSNIDDFDATTTPELEGCRYLDDSADSSHEDMNVSNDTDRTPIPFLFASPTDLAFSEDEDDTAEETFYRLALYNQRALLSQDLMSSMESTDDFDFISPIKAATNRKLNTGFEVVCSQLFTEPCITPLRDSYDESSRMNEPMQVDNGTSSEVVEAEDASNEENQPTFAGDSECSIVNVGNDIIDKSTSTVDNESGNALGIFLKDLVVKSPLSKAREIIAGALDEWLASVHMELQRALSQKRIAY